MSDAPLGTLSRHGDGYVVRFERHLPHAREKVWRAITESEHLAHWLPCDIVGERAAGSTVQLPFWPAHRERYGPDMTPELSGRIEVWDPPAVFEWWWHTDRLRWELHPADGGTRLVFTTWLGPDSGDPSQTAAGYHVCLDNLSTLLDLGTAPPLADVDPSSLEDRYAEVVAEV